MKVRLQSNPHVSPIHRNSVDCALNMYREGGLRSFYRGVAAPMAGVGIAQGAMFTVQLELRTAITNYRGTKKTDLSGQLQNASNLSLVDNLFCATCGAVANAVCMTPFDVIKIRLQTESMHPHRKYFGAIHCARSLYREGGVKKLFLGLHAAILRDIPGMVVWFGAYGNLRRMLPQSQQEHHQLSSSFYANFFPVAFAGGCAGVAQVLVVHPLDTIKTRLQSAKSGTYIDALHVARDLYATQGGGAFYFGVGPALYKAFFASAACWIGVETTMKALKLSGK